MFNNSLKMIKIDRNILDSHQIVRKKCNFNIRVFVGFIMRINYSYLPITIRVRHIVRPILACYSKLCLWNHDGVYFYLAAPSYLGLFRINKSECIITITRYYWSLFLVQRVEGSPLGMYVLTTQVDEINSH